MTRTRRLLSFLVYAAMIGGGLYWLSDMLSPEDVGAHHGKLGKLLLLAGAFPALIGGYLMWVDIIAPALGIKTQEEAMEAEDAARKRRELTGTTGTKPRR